MSLRAKYNMVRAVIFFYVEICSRLRWVSSRMGAQ